MHQKEINAPGFTLFLLIPFYTITPSRCALTFPFRLAHPNHIAFDVLIWYNNTHLVCNFP